MKSSSKRLFLGFFLVFLLQLLIYTRWFLTLRFLENYNGNSQAGLSATNEGLSVLDPAEDVLRIWNQYKQQHSVNALREETANVTFSAWNTTRKFAVGYYSCPLQAGNRLHHFMNSLIWAVITNRTLLWKYYDKSSCEAVGRLYARSICQAANQESDCSKVLKRADWLPALHEWVTAYRLSDPVPLPYWTTRQAQTTHRFWYIGAEYDAGLADSTPERFVDFPQMLGQDSYQLRHKQQRQQLLSTMESQQRARRLVGSGADYLYGLVLSESFTFQQDVHFPAIFKSSRNSTNINTEFTSKNIDEVAADGISIVVHSRHSNVSDEGASIQREILCLERILSHSPHESCQVMLLSDRSLTLQSITLHLNERYPLCQPLVAPHVAGFSFTVEHGPFSGLGFYQDLAMVSNQTRLVPSRRVAFVGSKRRSSSQLVREIMAYELHPKITTNRNPPELTTCYLEDVKPHMKK